MKHHIHRGWLSYRTQVVTTDAPPVQIAECRRAFYAGAQMLLATIMTNLSPGNEVQPEDQALMRDISAELEAFKESVARGEA